ncbi:beta-lactamase [Hyaloscypha finlandica]|nr:beta-lactamase [Hyaloscypha finlandica]
MATIDASAINGLKAEIDKVTSNPDGAGGIVYCAVNKNGDLIFEHASGKLGKGRPEPMTKDTVFWIASCTKMIVGIACMQLVEQGQLALDDVELVEKIAPELKAVKVLEGGKLVPKKKGITLRMLLSHTAGFGYSFFNERLNGFYGATGLDEFTGNGFDVLTQPLVNQPGSRWEYGINIDWAGILVERVSGLSLNDYFQKNIFKPMGLQAINFFPTDHMKQNLAYMHARAPDGKLSLRLNGQLLRKPLTAQTPEEIKATFNTGGAGCFAKPAEYCQIIATLLNDGVHAKSGHRLLKKETVDQMFTNQIPDFPDFGRQGINPPKPDYSNPLPDLYPQGDLPQGWGLTFFLDQHPGATGRSGRTGWWAGLPNLFWWADRENGLGGMIASQILPFGDGQVMGLWGAVEAGLYQALKK